MTATFRTAGVGSAVVDAFVAQLLADPVETLVLRGVPGPEFGAVVTAARNSGVRDVELDFVPTSRGVTSQHATLGRDIARGALSRAIITVGRADPRVELALARELLDAEVSVVARIVVEQGFPAATQRIRWLNRAEPRLRTVWLAAHTLDAASMSELSEAADVCIALGVEVSLAPERPIPPCVAALPEKRRPLLRERLRRTGRANDACLACATCALADVCTFTEREVERAAKGVRAPEPVPAEAASSYLRPGRSAGSRLHVLGARDVERFFHVDYEWNAEGDDPSRATSRIGIIYRCNQKCTFCELADMDVDMPSERVRGALEAARARGSNRVIITGGEPTLSPDLVSHVAYAKTLGFTVIEIQTNAVRLARPGLARALADAGLTHAQISLHGPDGAISDKLTAAPGTHARTLAGVDALLEAGVVCLLNHLVFKDNCHLLEAFVSLVDTRWGRFRERVVVQFHSPRNEYPSRAEALAHVPRYAEYAAALRRAIDLARAKRIEVRDLQDPTGIPSLCVLGADETYLGPILEQAALPRLHRWESDWMMRVDACRSCDVSSACMGAPRHYVALFGDDEFRPIIRRAR